MSPLRRRHRGRQGAVQWIGEVEYGISMNFNTRGSEFRRSMRKEAKAKIHLINKRSGNQTNRIIHRQKPEHSPQANPYSSNNDVRHLVPGPCFPTPATRPLSLLLASDSACNLQLDVRTERDAHLWKDQGGGKASKDEIQRKKIHFLPQACR